MNSYLFSISFWSQQLLIVSFIQAYIINQLTPISYLCILAPHSQGSYHLFFQTAIELCPFPRAGHISDLDETPAGQPDTITLVCWHTTLLTCRWRTSSQETCTWYEMTLKQQQYYSPYAMYVSIVVIAFYAIPLTRAHLITRHWLTMISMY